MAQTQPTTYGEHINKLKRDSYTIYQSCGGMRDCATLDEKEYWNNLRGLLNNVWDEFVKLENHISPGRYDEKL